MSNMQSMTFRKILNLAAAGVEKHNELKRLMAVVLVCGTLGLYAQSRTTGFCDQELYLRNYPCSGARFVRTRSVDSIALWISWTRIASNWYHLLLMSFLMVIRY